MGSILSRPAGAEDQHGEHTMPADSQRIHDGNAAALAAYTNGRIEWHGN
ncbi:hypothetical protein [Hydrocarboniphaga sp.]